MSAICRVCGGVTQRGNNSFYCDRCREVWKNKGAKRYQLGTNKKNCVWIRNNTIVRVIIEGKDVEPIYVLKEIIE